MWQKAYCWIHSTLYSNFNIKTTDSLPLVFPSQHNIWNMWTNLFVLKYSTLEHQVSFYWAKENSAQTITDTLYYIEYFYVIHYGFYIFRLTCNHVGGIFYFMLYVFHLYGGSENWVSFWKILMVSKFINFKQKHYRIIPQKIGIISLLLILIL